MSLTINNIYQSISGEVSTISQGSFVTIVRLSGCNLQCSYCFGIKPGRRKPKVILSTKPNKKIYDVSIGDALLTFDETGNLVETYVTHIMKREVDKYFELKINGTIYYVTPEHPFFTTNGLINVNELSIGDKIYHSSYKDKLSFSKRGYRNPMKDKDVAIKSANNTDYISMGKKLSNTLQKKIRDGEYIHPWSNLDEERKNKIKKASSERMMGNKNPNWNDLSECRKQSNYLRLKEEASKGRHICSVCRSSLNINIHHIDGNIYNDDINNLKILCHSCHSKEHQIGYNFWAKRRHLLKSGKLINGLEVESIKYIDTNKSNYSKITAYNLSCSPYNTYLIDYMWVHNCDAQEARDGIGYEISEDQIYESIRSFGNKNILITGGEPLLQIDGLNKLMLDLLLKYNVVIETNGTINPWVAPFFDNIDFVVDYKMPFSGCFTDMKLENFMDLRRFDIIKFVCDSEFDVKTAFEISEILLSEGCKAKMAIGQTWRWLQKKDFNLVNYLIEKDKKDFIVNFQVHKILNVE